MWNNLNLKCPVADVCQYNIQERAILKEIPAFIDILQASAKMLTHNHPIFEELKVFRNVQEKYRRIMHSDKGVRLLMCVGTNLRKLFSLKLHETYLDLAQPFLKGLESKSLPIILPSCQQLDYVLLRTQAAAKIINVALHYSKEAFCFLMQTLRMGRLILNLMMAISVTARVNILLRDILTQIFDNYKKLYVWQGKLKKGIAEWPEPLDLPEDLETWLNPESSDLIKLQDIPEGQYPILSSFFKKENAEPIEEDNKEGDQNVPVGESSRLQLENFDVGEAIPRPKKIKKELTELDDLLLKKIQNADSLEDLKSLWHQFDRDSKVLLGKASSPDDSIEIKRLFFLARKRLKKIYHSEVTDDVKENKKAALILLIRKRLAKHLGLTETESAFSTGSAAEDLKPVKTLRELRELYNKLYEMLQSAKQYEKCDKLEKKFKSRRSKIKHLIQTGEKIIARKTIISTSKNFLTVFKS